MQLVTGGIKPTRKKTILRFEPGEEIISSYLLRAPGAGGQEILVITSEAYPDGIRKTVMMIPGEDFAELLSLDNDEHN